MNIRKSDDFIADLERQFEWYVVNARWNIAERFLSGVQATCQLLGRFPKLGPAPIFLTHACVYSAFSGSATL
jgi:plasmid stabilization system protein ParE